MRRGSIRAVGWVLLGHLIASQTVVAQTASFPATPPGGASADTRNDPATLLKQAVGDMQRAMAAGNRSEVVRLADQAYGRLRSEAGPDHPLTAVALFNLGAAQRQAGATDDAAVTLKRALALETTLGPSARDNFRRVLRELAEVERGRGQTASVIVTYDAVIARVKLEAPGSITEAELLEEHAQLLRHAGLFPRAEAQLQAALAIKQARLPAGDPGLITTLTHLGGVSRLNGRPLEAEAYYQRAIAIVVASKGEKDPNLAILIDNLGVLYQSIGRDADAEVQHKRALAIFEETLGREHVSTGQCVANLGAVAYKQGRYSEAEGLFQRALAVYRAKLAPGDWRIGVTLDNLAGVWRSQRQFDKAATGYAQALDILRKAYSDTHPDVGTALNNLALMYAETGRLADAERAIGEALAIVEKAQGTDHLDVALVLNTQGFVHARQGRLDDARRDYQRSVATIEKAVGSDHPLLVDPLSAIGEMQVAAGETQTAISTFQRAAAIELKRRTREGAREQQASRSRMVPFLGYVAASWQQDQSEGGAQASASGKTGPQNSARADEALLQAQWALETQAGRAVALLGARLGARVPALAVLARERQDLGEEWVRTDKSLTALLAQTSAVRRDGDDAALRLRLREIDARLLTIDATLAKDHPGFSQLALPRPLEVKEMKTVLRPSEALLVYLPAEKHVYAWLVTRTETRWQRIDLPLIELERKVRTLRCGLDPAEWWDEARARRCADLTGGKSAGGILPFDAVTSLELYKALIVPFGASLEGKHILLAAGNALSSLPLQVLLSEMPRDGSLAKAKWLGLRHPMTTLPSIASLKLLRREARSSTAGRPYIGIGNPLLLGPNREYSYAFAAQSCLVSSLKKPNAPTQVAFASDGRSRGALMRGEKVDVELLRLLNPLPETRDEICAVLNSVGGSDQDLAMGSKASEKHIRELNASGVLRSYRVMHFATHGLIAGEVPGLTEAALVMTPPIEAKGDDDGLLTASEIATFKLDADWVILSACNTAAGDSLGAETLSGLARAFFHAGARSLLVSHWPVQSAAAVKLTTRALGELRKSPGLARAEALRRSMAALVADTSDPTNAHPQVWAPFVVVGEGGGSITSAPMAAAPIGAPALGSSTELLSPAQALVPVIAPLTASPQSQPGVKPWTPPWIKRPVQPALEPSTKATPSKTPSSKAPSSRAPAAESLPAPGPLPASPAATPKMVAPAQPAKVAPVKPATAPPGPTVSSKVIAPEAKAPLAPAVKSVAPVQSPIPVPGAEGAPLPKAQKSLTDSLFRSAP